MNTTGRSKLTSAPAPRHANSTVTQHVVDKARATILRRAEGVTHDEKVADAAKLMAMLDLVEPGNLFRPIEVGDSSTMGADS